METLILKVDTIANANMLAAFLKTVKPVKSVVLEKHKHKIKPKSIEKVVASEDAQYDWINPTRPATEEEIEKMLDECEASTTFFTTEELRKNIKK